MSYFRSGQPLNLAQQKRGPLLSGRVARPRVKALLAGYLKQSRGGMPRSRSVVQLCIVT